MIRVSGTVAPHFASLKVTRYESTNSRSSIHGLSIHGLAKRGLIEYAFGPFCLIYELVAPSGTPSQGNSDIRNWFVGDDSTKHIPVTIIHRCRMPVACAIHSSVMFECHRAVTYALHNEVYVSVLAS